MFACKCISLTPYYWLSLLLCSNGLAAVRATRTARTAIIPRIATDVPQMAAGITAAANGPRTRFGRSHYKYSSSLTKTAPFLPLPTKVLVPPTLIYQSNEPSHPHTSRIVRRMSSGCTGFLQSIEVVKLIVLSVTNGTERVAALPTKHCDLSRQGKSSSSTRLM